MRKQQMSEALIKAGKDFRDRPRIIWCSVDEIELEGDEDQVIPSTSVCCSRCGHTTESFGTSSRSVKRCLVLLREECPQGEENFYADEAERPVRPPAHLPQLTLSQKITRKLDELYGLSAGGRP